MTGVHGPSPLHVRPLAQARARTLSREAQHGRPPAGRVPVRPPGRLPALARLVHGWFTTVAPG